MHLFCVGTTPCKWRSRETRFPIPVACWDGAPLTILVASAVLSEHSRFGVQRWLRLRGKVGVPTSGMGHEAACYKKDFEVMKQPCLSCRTRARRVSARTQPQAAKAYTLLLLPSPLEVGLATYSRHQSGRDNAPGADTTAL